MKVQILSKFAPAPIGPYSQAIRAGDWLFVSGTLGIDPGTGALVPGDAAAQAGKALANLTEILKSSGATPRMVVKTTIFLKDMDDFAKVNDVYATVFTHEPPARSTVQVARLPKDALVEIDAVAFLK
jgi:2-iminobutanoate/2-iminopropanoate deaminase